MLLQRLRGLIIGLALVGACSTFASQATFNGTGNFSAGGNWSGGTGTGGIPAAGQDIAIGSGAICTFDAAASSGPYGALSFGGSSSLTFGSTNTLDVTDVTGTSPATLNIGSGTLVIRGVFTVNSMTTTLNGGTVEYAGSSAQTAPALAYGSLVINNSAGVSMAAGGPSLNTLTIGNTTANSVFKDNGTTIALVGTKTIDMQNGATYIVGSAGVATTFPAFTTASFSPGTTIEFATTNVPQVVTNRADYQNVVLSGASSTKQIASGITVFGTLTVNGSTTIGTNDVMLGDVAGSNGIGMSTGHLIVSGNWTNTGGTAGGTGEVKFTGANPTITGTTFENIHFQHTGTATVSGSLTFPGSCTIDPGVTVQVNDISDSTSGALSVGAGAILRISGANAMTAANTTFNTGSRVDYNGTAAQTIAADDYQDLEISQNRGVNTVTLDNSNPIGIAGSFFNNASFSTGGGYDASGNTIEYNGTAAQTITPFPYHDLAVTGAYGAGANVTFGGPAPIGISSSLSLASASFPGGGQFITAGSVIEFNGTAGQQNIGTPFSGFAYDTLLISNTYSSGVLLTDDLTVKKDLVVASGASINFGIYNVTLGGNVAAIGFFDASGGTLTMDGAATQVLSIPQGFINNLSINNPANVVLASDVEVQSTLDLSAGKVLTGTNKLIINDGVIFAPTDSSHVVGTVRMGISGGAGIPPVGSRGTVGSRNVTVTFPIGDGFHYIPVALINPTTPGGGYVEVSVSPADSSSIPSSGLDPTKSVNHSYKVVAASMDPGFSLTLPFVASDLDSGVNTAKLTARLFDGSAWSTPTVSNVGPLSVQIDNLAAAFTGEFQIAEPFTAGVPQITALSISQNPVKVGVPVTLTVTLADPSASSFAWDFGDGSPVATTNPVSHTFNIEGSFDIKLTVVNPAGSTNGTLTLKTFAPASGGSGVKNVSDGAPPVSNPLNGLTIKVMSSDGGVIELAIDVDALNRAAFDVSTDFDSAFGRQSSATGTNPVTKVDKAGIIVATSTATDTGTKNVRGKVRKTIPVSRKETGQTPLATAAPASTEINLSSMKGKFLFNKDTPDSVTFIGTIELPAGMDLSQDQEFSMGMGNVIDTVTVNSKGKPTDASMLERIKKLSIKYPKLPKGQTTTDAGKTAKITITMSTANMDSIGFDTEGITTALRSDEAGQKSVPRTIQVDMVLAGIAYEGSAPVQYTVSKKGDAGVMSGRGSTK